MNSLRCLSYSRLSFHSFYGEYTLEFITSIRIHIHIRTCNSSILYMFMSLCQFDTATESSTVNVLDFSRFSHFSMCFGYGCCCYCCCFLLVLLLFCLLFFLLSLKRVGISNVHWLLLHLVLSFVVIVLLCVRLFIEHSTAAAHEKFMCSLNYYHALQRDKYTLKQFQRERVDKFYTIEFVNQA